MCGKERGKKKTVNYKCALALVKQQTYTTASPLARKHEEQVRDGTTVYQTEDYTCFHTLELEIDFALDAL